MALLLTPKNAHDLGSVGTAIVCDGSVSSFFVVSLNADIDATFENLSPGEVYGFFVTPNGFAFSIDGVDTGITGEACLACVALTDSSAMLVSVAPGSGILRSVSNIDALKLIPGRAQGDWIMVGGYAGTPLDGQDMMPYWWDAASVETPNVLTVIQATGVIVGRWKAVIPYGGVSARFFGATGDGVTDDLPAFEAFIAAKDAIPGLDLHIPAGRYLLSDALSLGTQAFLMFGDGYNYTSQQAFGDPFWPETVTGTVLIFPNVTDGLVIEDDNVAGIRIRELAIVGAGSGATSGFRNQAGAGIIDLTIENVFIGNFSRLLDPGAPEESVFSSIRLMGGETGIPLDAPANTGGMTNCVFENLDIQFCDVGVLAEECTGVKFVGSGTLLQNCGIGILVKPGAGKQVSGFEVEGAWFENQSLFGLRFDTSEAGATIVAPVVSGCHFGGAGGGDTANALTFIGPGAAAKCSIVHNVAQGVPLTIPSHVSGLAYGNSLTSFTNNSPDAFVSLDYDYDLRVPQLTSTAWVKAPYFAAPTGTPATSGLIRGANAAPLLRARNAGDTADVNVLTVNGDNSLTIGDGANCAYHFVTSHDGGYLNVTGGGNVINWTATRLNMNIPIAGDGVTAGSVFALNGEKTGIDFGDVDYTEVVANYSMRRLEYVGVKTGVHTVTFPAPANALGYYEKSITNNTSGGFAITFKCGAGATINIAAGKTAILGFHSTGDVVRITADA